MEYSSSFADLFSSYWWWDWVSAPDGNDKDYNACMSRQNTKRTSDWRPYSWLGLPELLTAAEKHQASRVKRLLGRGADIQFTDGFGRTPLHLAASDYHGNTIEVLLQAGAKINGENNDGDTPIHRAASTPHGEKRSRHVEVLIQGGTDVNHPNKHGATPLHKACSQEIVEALLQAGADIHSRDRSGGTPLHRARSAKVAKALLLAGADANSRDRSNVTPLHLVWQNREGRSGIELAQVLVDAGADVNACADVGPLVAPNVYTAEREDVWTPLEWVQRELPLMGCTIPFGPSRSRRAAYDRRKADHAEIVSFLEGRGDDWVGEAEKEEKQIDAICRSCSRRSWLSMSAVVTLLEPFFGYVANSFS
jgi:ankyrin repeat protein